MKRLCLGVSQVDWTMTFDVVVQVMELLMALHQQQLSGDDSQMGILLKASARIARCMKVLYL